jgi:uncharacterized protein (DUF58 family)
LRVRVLVERPEVAVLSLGEAAGLELRVSHDARAPLRIELRQVLPASLGGGSVKADGICGAGAVLPLRLAVEGEARGEAHLAKPWVGVSRFGLVERLLQTGEEQLVRVLPDVREVGRINKRMNALFLRGIGTRIAPRIGQGREFDRLREYVAGDDYRQVAWKASARQGKLIVRQFRVERSQDVLLCVDRGHRMAARVANRSRTDHAVDAAVLAAYVCNRAEDRVGLLSFCDTVEGGVAQGRGGDHLAQVTRFATGIEPAFLPTDYRALAAHLRRRLRARTLVFVFTVLPERGDHQDLLAAVRMLLPRHLPLVLVLKDANLEATAHSLPSDEPSLFRTLVASELVHDVSLLGRELRQLGALVIETTAESSGTAAVNAYLDVKRRQLL